MENKNDSELIDKLGGTMAVARLCEVSSQAVSKWRVDGIPNARRMYLKLIKPEFFLDEEKKNRRAKERRTGARRAGERRDGVDRRKTCTHI